MSGEKVAEEVDITQLLDRLKSLDDSGQLDELLNTKDPQGKDKNNVSFFTEEELMDDGKMPNVSIEWYTPQSFIADHYAGTVRDKKIRFTAEVNEDKVRARMDKEGSSKTLITRTINKRKKELLGLDLQSSAYIIKDAHHDILRRLMKGEKIRRVVDNEDKVKEVE